MTDYPTYMTTEQAARFLGNISPSNLVRRRWLRLGPTYVKIGSLVRYRKADLERFVEQCVVEPE